ncbi:hypothetical protein [Siccirubricoccus phaeus]|uniref:hypothetical protein n=1 Tax=Siccirubricoccus phaeus TaxID=2595053 RepID=UPI0011F1BCB1|nr:hypothetical protein [Siccirubricoccus phaeus]
MPKANDPDNESVDRAALRLMLNYVEAECLRIGATEAARHAALAAAMMPPPVPPAPLPLPRRSRMH